MYFRFCGWRQNRVMFSNNGNYRPKSKTTRIFRPVRQVADCRASDNAVWSRSRWRHRWRSLLVRTHVPLSAPHDLSFHDHRIQRRKAKKACWHSNAECLIVFRQIGYAYKFNFPARVEIMSEYFVRETHEMPEKFGDILVLSFQRLLEP